MPCGTGRKATPAAAMATPPARYSRRDIAARGVQASHTSQSQSHSHSFRLRGHRHGFLARPRGVRRNGYGSIEHAVWRLRAQVMPSPSMSSVCADRQMPSARHPSGSIAHVQAGALTSARPRRVWARISSPHRPSLHVYLPWVILRRIRCMHTDRVRYVYHAMH